MRTNRSKEWTGYLSRNRYRRAWRKVVSVLACIVVFCTTYALMLPAITMEKKGCGKAEHTHTEICYQSGGLICGLEEHAHSLACYSDPEADVETAEIWENSVSGVTLTGRWGEDLVAIAESQIGYQKSQKNYEVQEDGTTVNGYSRYGAWYGEPYGEWNTLFVSFCLRYAKVAGMPYTADPAEMVRILSEKGLLETGADYIPQPGELIFFDSNGDNEVDRMGIVEKYIAASEENKEKIVTIECDSDGPVHENGYAPGASTIFAYGHLPTPEGSYSCGMSSHLHDRHCYGLQEDLLLCPFQEHTHSEQCAQLPMTELTSSGENCTVSAR